MAAALAVVPRPALAGSVVDITGSGFANAKTRLTLDGVGATTNVFRPRRDGSFDVGITVSATPGKSQTLVAEQYVGGRWTVAARLTPLLTFAQPTQNPLQVTSVTPVVLGNTSVLVNWTSNVLAIARIDYGTTTGYGTTHNGSTIFATSGGITVTGLTANTLYHFRITLTDQSGFVSVQSADVTATTTTTGADITPPTITNVTASGLTNTSATISWDLSETGTGQYEWGLTPAYGSFGPLEASCNLYTHHVQALSGLLPGTQYHYRVRSADCAGNLAISGDFTFTTTGTSGGGGGGGGGTYPPDTTLTYVAPDSPALPTLGVKTADATWGTHYTRITNTSGLRHNYANQQAFSADNSKISLCFPPNYAILDATTYATLATFGIGGTGYWSNVDSNKMWSTDSSANPGVLNSQNATTGAVTTVKTFTGYTKITLGEGEGGIDDNDRYTALYYQTGGGSGQGVLIYDIIGDRIAGTIALSAGASLDNCQISRKGNYCILNFNTDGTGNEQGVWLFTNTGTRVRQLTNGGSRHADMGLDAAGNEVYVHLFGSVTCYALPSGAATTIFASGTAFQASHISCRNTNRPGWAYLSVYDYAGTTGLPGNDQLVAAKLDGSGTIEVYGFSRSRAGTYNSQPQATVNRDGTKMLFASDWGATNIYAYIAEL